jgi:hypothetical protein
LSKQISQQEKMSSIYHNTIPNGRRGNKRNNKRKTDQATYAPSKISNQPGYFTSNYNPFANNATAGSVQTVQQGGMLTSSYFISQEKQKPYVKFVISKISDIRLSYINGEKMLRFSQGTDIEEKRGSIDFKPLMSDETPTPRSTTVFLTEKNFFKLLEIYGEISKIVTSSGSYNRFLLGEMNSNPIPGDGAFSIPCVIAEPNCITFLSYVYCAGRPTLYGEFKLFGNDICVFESLLSDIQKNLYALPAFESVLIQTVNRVLAETLLNLMGRYGPFQANDISLENERFRTAFFEYYSELSNTGFIQNVMRRTTTLLKEQDTPNNVDLFSLVFQVLHCLPSLVSAMKSLLKIEDHKEHLSSETEIVDIVEDGPESPDMTQDQSD